MEQNHGLVILQHAMNKRFEAIGRAHGMPVCKTDLKNNFEGNMLKNVLVRLKQKSKIAAAVDQIENFIKDFRLSRLYLSNAEGYVAHNVIFELRKRNYSLEIVALQHGVFPLVNPRTKETVRDLINKLSKTVFGIFPFGTGFGGIRIDKYYVFSNREKDFLLEEKGWHSNNVEVAPNFIKIDLIEKYKSLEIAQEKDDAIFLGQCLSLVGLCSAKMEKYYVQQILNYLSEQHKRLYIKSHPSCNSIFDTIDLPDNVVQIDDMLVGFSKCKTAYSFFSTALIDAKIFALKTVGIWIEDLKIDSEIYENFDLKLPFEKIITYQG